VVASSIAAGELVASASGAVVASTTGPVVAVGGTGVAAGPPQAASTMLAITSNTTKFRNFRIEEFLLFTLDVIPIV
jgi:hypothetical protein